MRTTLLFFLCTLLAGCVESNIPLSPFAALPLGHPLLGTWVHRDQKEQVYLHIGNEENGLKLLQVELDDKGALKSESYQASATTLAGKDYLSIRLSEKDRVFYYIWKFRIAENGTLTFWAPDHKFMEKAVNQGLIAGEAHAGKFITVVKLSADQQALQRFIAEHDAKIFSDESSTLKRLK
ncbi:MAG: hypothetical protein H6R18_2308 [Proteobacteria bacterium]|nr:hypothetical protein [Pseudomonadota bacterium]